MQGSGFDGPIPSSISVLENLKQLWVNISLLFNYKNQNDLIHQFIIYTINLLYLMILKGSVNYGTLPGGLVT